MAATLPRSARAADSKSPLRGQDVVLLYGPPWDGPTRFSKHHLARYLGAHGNRVLYVEAPLTPFSLARAPATAPARLARALAPARNVERGVWVRSCFTPVPYHDATSLSATRWANRFGQQLLRPMLRQEIKRLGFGTSPLVIAGLPHALDALDALRPRGVVYHCADDYARVRGFPRTLPELEADLCRRADLVIVTAETLLPTRAAINPRTRWIANGVEYQHFSQPAAPAAEVAMLGRPIVGFIGGLSEWVDVSLLRALALAQPGYRLVLVGPSSVNLAPLRGLSNVTLLGPRPYERLPAYLAAMDVAIVPFKQNAVTRGADPIKVYEYLAAGLPVVSTTMPSLQRLSHVVQLARSVDEFIAQVENAVAAGRDSGRAERQAEAARHDWSVRFTEFERLVAECVPLPS